MKSLLRLTGVAILALVPAFAGAQQAQTIAYGRTTVNLSSAFQQTIASMGATLTDLNSAPATNGSTVFPIATGVIDLQTGVGELISKGGYLITAGGTVIKIQDFIVDLSTPTSPVVTGVFVVNGTVMPREPVFQLQLPSGFSLPLTPQNGVEVATGFTATFAPAAASTINTVFGGPVIQANAFIGTVDFYGVLAVSGSN